MAEELKEKLSSLQRREYTLSDDERADLKRVLSKIIGRKVTGQLTVDLGPGGGINRVRLLEETSGRTE